VLLLRSCIAAHIDEARFVWWGSIISLVRLPHLTHHFMLGSFAATSTHCYVSSTAGRICRRAWQPSAVHARLAVHHMLFLCLLLGLI
jgi:hypothetical protein